MRTTFHAFIEYLLYQRNLSRATADAYTADFRQFRDWLLARKNRLTADRVDPDDIRQYIIHMRKSGLAQNSVLRHLNALSSFFDYCVKWHGLKANPVSYCERGKKVKHKVSVPPPEMIDHMYASVELRRRSFWSIQDRVILELFVSAGLRFSEVLTLPWEHVNFSERELIVIGKGNKARKVPMLGALCDAMLESHEEWTKIGKATAGQIVLNRSWRPAERTALRHWWRRYGRELQSNGFTFHSLRRYFATRLNRVHGIGVVEIKELLGHEDLNTTLAYIEPDLQATKEKLKGIRI